MDTIWRLADLAYERWIVYTAIAWLVVGTFVVWTIFHFVRGCRESDRDRRRRGG
jgi:hypothetical protein